MKKQKHLKIKKLYFLGGVIGIVLVLGGITFATLQTRSKHNASTTANINTRPVDTTSDQAQGATTTEENTSSSPPPSTPPPAPAPVTKPVSVPFQISKVYFSQAPSTPAEATYNTCTLGQNIAYTATADITATTAGVATYHWAVGDHARGESKNYEDQTVTFASAGVKKVSHMFTYTVSDLGSYYGLSGTKFYNRQYLNVFVTAPNQTYANINDPVYGAGSFIWGTYLDLC
jgi:hypothetical protein